MAIDLKYGTVSTERGTIGQDEPVIVMRAQDRLLPGLLATYRTACENAGSPQHHLDQIDRNIAAVLAWQQDHATKTPSSDGMRGE